MQNIRKLNILMTYPVSWTVSMVFRDYIQNFFDAVEPEKFGEQFFYEYDKSTSTLTMKTYTTFDKEWLYYVGASTKREHSGCYAGKFGEGFKIASLVAYRDMKFSIQMESKDWTLSVTESDTYIDKTKVRCMAYNVEERAFENNSILTLIMLLISFPTFHPIGNIWLRYGFVPQTIVRKKGF